MIWRLIDNGSTESYPYRAMAMLTKLNCFYFLWIIVLMAV